jgi:hypothetical protein
MNELRDKAYKVGKSWENIPHQYQIADIYLAISEIAGVLAEIQKERVDG